jgi:hypothetical protein
VLLDDAPCDAHHRTRQDFESAARGRKKRSLELRAACDLALLWAGRCERGRATDLPAPVHNWFTEGIDTLELKQVEALLDELHA